MSQQKNFSIESLLRESTDSNNHDGQRLDAMSTSSTATSMLKSQRRRSTFSALQVHVLENEFYKHRYVSAEKRAGLAAFLGLSQQQIKIWFQNRRYKTKVKNGTSRRGDQRNQSTYSEQPLQTIVNVPLQSTNPSIFPAWLLQRR
ncbi:Homeobox protein Nkx-3 [Aphelenchoides bicaudatus]|nr:Homeobox protein Nkx-3 [Aphelenchoides bicaudatus]